MEIPDLRSKQCVSSYSTKLLNLCVFVALFYSTWETIYAAHIFIAQIGNNCFFSSCVNEYINYRDKFYDHSPCFEIF